MSNEYLHDDETQSYGRLSIFSPDITAEDLKYDLYGIAGFDVYCDQQERDEDYPHRLQRSVAVAKLLMVNTFGVRTIHAVNTPLNTPSEPVQSSTGNNNH